VDKGCQLASQTGNRYPSAPFGTVHPGCLTENQQVEKKTMKSDIHPSYQEIKVVCSCGNEFQTKSTLTDELHIDVCSSCHPFYTGTQKIIDTAGRVDKFRRKYGM
jgi:large subunit ribosomal protein L31